MSMNSTLLDDAKNFEKNIPLISHTIYLISHTNSHGT
jgi:hypothetical protein